MLVLSRDMSQNYVCLKGRLPYMCVSMTRTHQIGKWYSGKHGNGIVPSSSWRVC